MRHFCWSNTKLQTRNIRSFPDCNIFQFYVELNFSLFHAFQIMQSLIKVCPTECSLSGLVTATSFAVNLDPLIWKISKTEMELHNGWCIQPGTKQIESLCSAPSSLLSVLHHVTVTRSADFVIVRMCYTSWKIKNKRNILWRRFEGKYFGFCQIIIPPFSSLIPRLYQNAFLCFCYPQPSKTSFGGEFRGLFQLKLLMFI